MHITGSLRDKRGIYQMVVRIPTDDGGWIQKSKSTQIRVTGKTDRETRKNLLNAQMRLIRSRLRSGSAYSSGCGVLRSQGFAGATSIWKTGTLSSETRSPASKRYTSRNRRRAKPAEENCFSRQVCGNICAPKRKPANHTEICLELRIRTAAVTEHR